MNGAEPLNIGAPAYLTESPSLKRLANAILSLPITKDLIAGVEPCGPSALALRVDSVVVRAFVHSARLFPIRWESTDGSVRVVSGAVSDDGTHMKLVDAVKQRRLAVTVEIWASELLDALDEIEGGNQ